MATNYVSGQGRSVVSIAFVCGIAWGAAAQAGEIVVGALGDSITAGFDAERLGDNRELSWATGTSTLVLSHAQRLATATSTPVTTFNEAIVGSEIGDLDRQVTRLLTHAPDYVGLTIGANDVCHWAPDYAPQLATFEAKLTAEISRLVQARPNIRINLASIPNIYNLWQVSVAHAGCQERWDAVGLCRPLLSPTATEAERQDFVVRWHAANDALTRVAQGFHDNVMHNSALGDFKFEWQHVSKLDCFHPSIAGQNLLSELAWELVEQYPLP